ncbi:hypothetical protein [Dialister succinatiphilus]|uniref:hypothetical protein n=1 Tax=Dialister succinatiphilus TaxID=487173 RepID=UPI003AB088EE
MAFHTDRKLFAYSFPSGLTLSLFMPAGNYSPIVSYPLDSIAFHAGRKLFAHSFPSGLTPWLFTAAGNFTKKLQPQKG